MFLKKTLALLLLVFLAKYTVSAQSPQSIKYQGVARDAQNLPISKQLITVKISILQDWEGGPIVYQEVHKTMTTDLGIFNLHIGEGAPQVGVFKGLDWANYHYFLSTEIDVLSNGNFGIKGISQILAVPYAFHAETVTNNDDADADPLNEIQYLDFDPNTGLLSLSEGNSIMITADGDADSTNELQLLSYNEITRQLEISGGNVITLAPDEDSDPANELQILSLDSISRQLTISNGNTVAIPVDADSNPENELQILSFDTLSRELTISNGNIVIIPGGSDEDANPTNEIQTLQYSDSTQQLTISGGNSVTLNLPSNSKYNGNIYYISKQGNDSEAVIGNPSKPWADPQEAAKLMSNGSIMYFLSSKDTFLIDEGIYLDSLQHIQIIGNYATLLRAPKSITTATLSSNYSGGTTIIVDEVPISWEVGDFIHLITDSTNAGRSSRVKIASISGNTITTNDIFLDEYQNSLFIASPGVKVLKSYSMLWGRFSATEIGIHEGSNKNIMVENLIFDGNIVQNNINYSWFVNPGLVLNGQGSQIKGCVFINHPAEVVGGSGFNINNCRFENNGGSALHMSVHDNTFSDNANITFTNNIVKNCNLIPRVINGHNEGNISFSWNGGECLISGNFFVDTKKTSILGSLTGTNSDPNDRENIIFSNNRAYGFNEIIALDGSSHGLIINDNIFDDCGILNTQISGIESITSIKICNNLALNGTILATSFNHKCDNDLSASATADLNEAYDNFDSSPAEVILDGAQGQGDLVFRATSDASLRVNLENNGAFEIRRFTNPALYNFKVEAGNIFFKTPFYNNFFQFLDGNGQNILKIAPESNHLKFGSIGSDQEIAMGISNPATGGFQSGFLSFLHDFSFDQVGDVATTPYASRYQFGSLSDPSELPYDLMDFKATLNKSWSGRHYRLFNTSNIKIDLTGTAADTLTGFNWNPTVNSIGGEFVNRPFDIFSGTATFRENTDIEIMGNCNVTGSFSVVTSSMQLGSILIISGSGSPEGVVLAPVGSLYLRTDGSAGNTMYVKEVGVGNTGWVPK